MLAESWPFIGKVMPTIPKVAWKELEKHAVYGGSAMKALPQEVEKYNRKPRPNHPIVKPRESGLKNVLVLTKKTDKEASLWEHF